MKRSYFLLAAWFLAGVLFAQTPQGLPFQQAGSLAAGRGGSEAAAPPPRAEPGKPFSATVTTQNTTTLLDGTHISQTTTEVEYRDAQGRVRTESTEPAFGFGQKKVVTIRDPVAGAVYKLDPVGKTVERLPMETTVGGRGGSGPPVSLGERQQQMQVTLTRLKQILADLRAGKTLGVETTAAEDLGTSTVNGVPAQGRRSTTIVPAGAIGNDREFRSITERWFSSNLNLLIKSVSTDPRFGTTTYELTNIRIGPPDPALFQPPADYKPVSNVIEAIEFSGVKTVSQETLRTGIASKLGDVYDEASVRRDFAALWSTQRFEDIQVRTETGPRGGVIVRFIVTERR